MTAGCVGWNQASKRGSAGQVHAVVTILIVVVGVYLVVHLAFLTWRLRAPGLRVRRVRRGSARVEAMKRAAAANVEAIRESGKSVSPDAPGNNPDDL
jgi:uncharacterized iron-regulated membrane protein